MSFLEDAQRAAEALDSYDRHARARDGKVLVQPPARELQTRMDLDRLAREGGLTGQVLSEFVRTYLDGTITLRDPRNMGHQTAVPNAAGALGSFIDGYATNPMAINEMGPAASAIELFYIDWMLSKIGWESGESADPRAGGVLTHGGSLANLTALAAARAAIAPEAWKSGVPSDLVMIAPQSMHYSISRAIGILGLGQDALIASPVDEYGRACGAALADVIQSQRAAGKRIMAVAASACQTAAGLFDPLREIGEICQREGIWFHVDGAHGAGALLSEALAPLMDGVELADSVIWDAHKMLRTPCICAAVLTRDHRHLDTAFVQSASYIFHDKDNPGFDFIGRTVECTKAALGLKAFMALAEAGEAGLAAHIERQTALAREAYDHIHALPDFECAVEPEFNILCFRLTEGDETHALELRRRLLARGNYYTTYAAYRDEHWLRLALMNPETGMDDIRGLVEEIRLVAAEPA